jgi:hypothetical protein
MKTYHISKQKVTDQLHRDTKVKTAHRLYLCRSYRSIDQRALQKKEREEKVWKKEETTKGFYLQYERQVNT